MGLEALKGELAKKTQSESLRIDSEARMEIKKLREEAKKDYENRMEFAQNEAKETIAREKMRIPAARLKARRRIQDAKYEIVTDAFEELKKMLNARMSSGKKEYEKMLDALIKEGLEEIGAKNAIINVRKQDLQFAKKYGKTAEISCSGGAIISSEDGKLRINSTFEAILEKKKELLEQSAFEMLKVK
ncbi:MAG: V-type ATP synthase subunit E family protein [Candidatus Micrarchaeota archaeon]